MTGIGGVKLPTGQVVQNGGQFGVKLLFVDHGV
jgi:hypothetical protein